MILEALLARLESADIDLRRSAGRPRGFRRPRAARRLDGPGQRLERTEDGARLKLNDKIEILRLAPVAVSNYRQSAHYDEAHLAVVQRTRYTLDAVQPHPIPYSAVNTTTVAR